MARESCVGGEKAAILSKMGRESCVRGEKAAMLSKMGRESCVEYNLVVEHNGAAMATARYW